jgi:acetolactate synthase-1/2/3 large subunit
MAKGAEIIIDHLVKSGMPYIFGICGHGNVGFLDALNERKDEIKLVSPRHEQTAGHMADAYYRVAHSPVATLTSCGPGSANLPMSLACAQADSSAFLAITANVPTSQFNRGPFQESYFHGQAAFPDVIRTYVKRSFQPTRVEMLPLALRQATQLMTSGRPGPVNIDIPYNVFQEEADLVPDPQESLHFQPSRSGADPDDVKTVARMLLGAKRPLAFVGHGVTLSEASAELTELCHLLGLPVVNSPNGMGTLDMSDDLALGFIGRNGTYMANQAGRRCDVLLCLGARFDDRSSSSWQQGYSWNMPPTRLVQVDIDQTEIGRNYQPEIGIVADARTFLRQLIAELRATGKDDPSEGNRAWREQIANWRNEWNSFVGPNFKIDTAPARPERIVQDVQRMLPDDAILVLDSGLHHNWFMQFWEARRPQAMLNSWGFSAMGFGVSGALGAKLAAPHRPCVALVGDGGFTMTPHVLCTAVEYDIPVIWIIWNDYAWGAIRGIQNGMFPGREIGTSFTHGPQRQPYNPDFAALARAHGVAGRKVSRSQDFCDTLKEALALNKPYVIDLEIDPSIRPPSVGTWELPPLPLPKPAFGRAWQPGMEEV